MFESDPILPVVSKLREESLSERIGKVFSCLSEVRILFTRFVKSLTQAELGKYPSGFGLSIT